MRAILLLSLVALVPATVQAGEKETAEARAALELALSLRKAGPIAKHKAPRLDFAKAFAEAQKSGKPVLIHVGKFDCGNVCQECRDCIHADAKEVKGDSTPRLIVAYPTGDWLTVQRTFLDKPTLSQVRAELKAIDSKRQADCPQGR